MVATKERNKSDGILVPDAAKEQRRRIALAIGFSVALHLLVLVLSLPSLVSNIGDRGKRGEFMLVEGAPAPESNQVEQSVEPAVEAPLKTVEKIQRRARHASAEQILDTATLEPSEYPLASTAGEPETGVALMTHTVDAIGGSGHEGLETNQPHGGGYEGDGEQVPRPECLDGLDNDGDRLIDSEDPECQSPETPEEEVEVNTNAMLLSDLRRNDPLHGDPDDLLRDRVTARLRKSGTNTVYEDGSFRGIIAPDGSISFREKRRTPILGIGYERNPRSGWRALQRLRFLEATEELRDSLDRDNRNRFMKTALAGLRDDLSEIIGDRRLSSKQKKTILFQRLEECDLTTDGGRQAARTIIDFIREHARDRAEPASGDMPNLSGAKRSSL